MLHQISLDLVRVNVCFGSDLLQTHTSVLTTACHYFLAGPSNEASNICTSCSTSVAITAVVSCAVSFILGALVGAVVHYCTVRKKSNCQKCYSLTIVRKQQQQQQQPAPVYEDVIGQSQNIQLRKKSNCQKCYSLTIVRKQQQQQPVPVYEDVVGQSQNIELKENVAYGPVQQ